MKTPTPRVCKAQAKVKILIDEINAAYGAPCGETAEGALLFAGLMEKTSKKAKTLAGALKEWAQAVRAQERLLKRGGK